MKLELAGTKGRHFRVFPNPLKVMDIPPAERSSFDQFPNFSWILKFLLICAAPKKGNVKENWSAFWKKGSLALSPRGKKGELLSA